MSSLDWRLNGISWEYFFEYDIPCPRCGEKKLTSEPFTYQLIRCECGYRTSEDSLSKDKKFSFKK